MKRILMMCLSFMVAIPVFSQTSTSASSSQETMLMVVLVLVLITTLLILIVGMYLISIIKVILLDAKKRKALAEGKEYIPEKGNSWWDNFMNKATDAVPLDKEKSVLMDHDFDGIHELNNHLPPWWKWLFYFTIAWGVVYFAVYHVFDAAPLMHEEYEIVMEDARTDRAALTATEGNNIDESNVEFSDASEVMSSGKAIYDRSCVACHAAEGQGLIGPNFTDNYWIHGGSINDIFKVIKYGVPEKGMISWQSQLSASEMRDVSSYIMAFVGTTPKNPPAPKAPEGDEYLPETQENKAPTGNDIDENNVEFSDDPQLLANGKAIYDRACLACHAAEGQGMIGPNFTDNYWIHGGSINDIFKVIKYGVIEKGMIPWEGQLTPTEMRDVSSYIMTFVGTTPKNPPAPKAPEGEEYIPQ